MQEAEKGGLSEYAEKIGRSQPYVSQVRNAAEVLGEAKPISQLMGLLDKSQHLSAIHAMPKACWPGCVEWLVKKERDAKKKQLAAILSVSERTVRDWLSRMDKDAKEARNKRIFDLWLAGWTQQEIAAAVGIPKGTADTLCLKLATSPNLSKPQQSAANHAVKFNPPIYNIWSASNRKRSI